MKNKEELVEVVADVCHRRDGTANATATADATTTADDATTIAASK